eukprot:GHVH01000526.1.p1 GENE.GHVH01000526.1~~GHVH01000526.1.p1  ORF type:complete len:526 (+),score=45.18 GHVH01000526.1:96-1673(+)
MSVASPKLNKYCAFAASRVPAPAPTSLGMRNHVEQLIERQPKRTGFESHIVGRNTKGSKHVANVKHVPKFSTKTGQSRRLINGKTESTADTINLPLNDNRFNKTFDTKGCSQLAQHEFNQIRFKMLSWIINYIQSCAQLNHHYSDDSKRGIAMKSTFFMTAAIFDFGLTSFSGMEIHTTQERNFRVWILGLSAFSIAIKMEESRDRFDARDFQEIMISEGAPPWMRQYTIRKCLADVVDTERKILQRLDYQISEAFADTALGCFRMFLDVLRIEEDPSDSTTIIRLHIAHLLLQFTTLLLPDGVLDTFHSRESASKSEISINCLRAVAAWRLACHFTLNENNIKKPVDNSEPPIIHKSLVYSTISATDSKKCDIYLEGLITLNGRAHPYSDNLIAKRKAIDLHTRAMMDYIVEIASRMESNKRVQLYKTEKRRRRVLTRRKHQSGESFLVPIVSANRDVLILLAKGCQSDAYTSERLSHVETSQRGAWVHQTFRVSLGFPHRCSLCLEFGHNKAICKQNVGTAVG